MEGYRRFIDSTGFSWQIWEIAQAHRETFADRASPPSWLYFFSRGTTLVLRDYPEEWESLTWSEIETLRQNAEVLGSDTEVRVPAAVAKRRVAVPALA